MFPMAGRRCGSEPPVYVLSVRYPVYDDFPAGIVDRIQDTEPPHADAPVPLAASELPHPRRAWIPAQTINRRPDPVKEVASSARISLSARSESSMAKLTSGPVASAWPSPPSTRRGGHPVPRRSRPRPSRPGRSPGVPGIPSWSAERPGAYPFCRSGIADAVSGGGSSLAFVALTEREPLPPGHSSRVEALVKEAMVQGLA